ncbi:hypothetical protein ACS4JF_25265 [Bacillus thuringiensis]|uniref:hypothetical protein n=1 Tax=Bacillus thuringiensis TaxID=1428 RepID=UPI001FAE0D80|nr:hypothetical protein [Bacillus thuringiensis]MDM8364888.1 hypothetical protein [Bacillus thuringiensis]
MNSLQEKSAKTFDETVVFGVTKLIFVCGTVKYGLQGFTEFSDVLDFGMFETKDEAFARKEYYSNKDANYSELNLAERYSYEAE